MLTITRSFSSQRLIVFPFKKLSAVGFSRLKSINVTERKDDLLVEVQVPGFKKENLDLFVNDDTITLTGKMCESMHDQDEKRYEGEFSESLKFSGKIDPAKMSASLQHGLLKILVSKPAVEKGTRVEIS